MANDRLTYLPQLSDGPFTCGLRPNRSWLLRRIFPSRTTVHAWRSGPGMGGTPGSGCNYVPPCFFRVSVHEKLLFHSFNHSCRFCGLALPSGEPRYQYFQAWGIWRNESNCAGLTHVSFGEENTASSLWIWVTIDRVYAPENHLRLARVVQQNTVSKIAFPSAHEAYIMLRREGSRYHWTKIFGN